MTLGHVRGYDRLVIGHRKISTLTTGRAHFQHSPFFGRFSSHRSQYLRIRVLQPQIQHRLLGMGIGVPSQIMEAVTFEVLQRGMDPLNVLAWTYLAERCTFPSSACLTTSQPKPPDGINRRELGLPERGFIFLVMADFKSPAERKNFLFRSDRGIFQGLWAEKETGSSSVSRR